MGESLNLLIIPTNEINCRLYSITSERIGNPDQKAAAKCVHEYNQRFPKYNFH